MLKRCKKRSWARILTILFVGGLLFAASAIAAGVMQGGSIGSPLLTSNNSGTEGKGKNVFGPETFTRTEGKPDEFARNFRAEPGKYMLGIRNNNVTSARVTVNGKNVATPEDFKKGEPKLVFGIVLEKNNTLCVQLASKPGTSITIIIANPERKEPREVTALVLKVRWGYFDEKERHASDAMVPWDGFIETTRSGIKVLKLLRFDQGGNYSNGGDDRLIRGTAPNVVQWKSSTTTNWDGIIVAMRPPERKETNDTYVTIYLTQWTKVYKISELIDINVTIPVDTLGHAIEIQGKICKIPCKDVSKDKEKSRPAPPPDDGKDNKTCPPKPEPPLPPKR
jgi:hypothetical protein